MIFVSGIESEDVLLVHRVNSVLPVDLYDTTGERDLHLNGELVKMLARGSDIKCEYVAALGVRMENEY